MENEGKKVSMFIGYYFYPCFILLHRKLDKKCSRPPECYPKSLYKPDDDPGIRIWFATAQNIHNCLSLVSVTTIGHAINLPLLTAGEKYLVKVVRKV